MSAPLTATEPINLVHKVMHPAIPAGQRAPALVMMHGRGTDENDLLALADRFDSRLMLISLRAPYPFPFGGYTWYSTTMTGAPDPITLHKSLTRLGRFIDLLPRLYLAAPAEIYLLGFSMGAAMALGVVRAHPARFAGVIAHSGFIPDTATPKPVVEGASRTPCFLAHGLNDQVVPLKSGHAARDQLVDAGFAVEFREYPIGHEISQQSFTDMTIWLNARLDEHAAAAAAHS